MPHPRHSVTVGGNNNNRTVPAKQEKRQPFPYSSTAILGEKSVINTDSRKDLIHLTATALKDAFFPEVLQSADCFLALSNVPNWAFSPRGAESG